MSIPNTVLFLNDNPLPPIYTQGTIAAKELRLRSAIDQIHQIIVLAFVGQTVQIKSHRQIGPLEKKVKVILLPPWPYYLRSLPLFFAGLYYRYKYHPSIIEAESPIISGVAAVILGRLTQTKTLIEVRASYHQLIKFRLRFMPYKIKRYFLHHVLHFVYSRADIIIANSRTYARRIKNMGYPSAIINPGLQYLPASKPSPKKQLIVGYMGRLVIEKGVDLFIQAISQLDTNLLDQINIEIAGEGPQLNRLKKQAQHLGLGHKIAFLGMVDNYSTLSRWSILINPVLVQAPLEMINIEAAALGIPVICFKHGNAPETVSHNLSGIKLSHTTSTSLAQAITQLITDKKMYQRLSRQAILFAQKNYAFEHQVEKLKQLYHQHQII